MKKIGITGGIGSGKSTVCKIFESLGVPVYYTDNEARSLTNHHPDIINGFRNLFGDEIYINGELNRKKVGESVFRDKNLLADLNKLIHPIVAEHFDNWFQQHSNSAYILKEAAILFESGAYKQVDKIITVTAPIELRIKRVMERDGISEGEVMDRINNQWNDQEKIKMSDFIVYCDDVELVIPQVIKIHKNIIEKI